MRLCFLSKPRLMEQRGPTRPKWSELKRRIRTLKSFVNLNRRVSTGTPSDPSRSRSRARLFAISADAQPPVPVLAFALHRKKRDAT